MKRKSLQLMYMLLTEWNQVQSEVQKKLPVRLKNSLEMQKTELKWSKTGLNSVSRTKQRIKLKTQLRILLRNHLKMLPKNPLKNLSEQHLPKHSTEGEKVFAEIPVRYNVLKKKVADNILDAPSVMLNTPYGDSWFMPSTESYVARLIKDAGGDYIYKKNTGNASAPIDLEEAYLLASQADMWLHVGMANTLDELKAACPKFIDTRCFRGGQVYNNNARTNAAGGNDYYESAVVNPDLVLRDLVKIFHPELVEEDFVYYKQLK